MFSPEIEGRRIGEARPEWEVFFDLAQRVRPDLIDYLSPQSTQELREEIARVVPFYTGIETLRKTGDQVQYGGAHLCEGWNFGTADGRARFTAVPLPKNAIPDGMFAVATRRGKQFNTMVKEAKDALTGAPREAVLMNAADAAELQVRNGDPIRLVSQIGTYEGRVFIAPITRRNLQVHWPEGNVLLDHKKRSPESHVPDYNAFVRVERLAAGGAEADEPARAPEPSAVS
jgi:anaerobic selenocysteine-containing dehydrogenase